MFIAADMPVL